MTVADNLISNYDKIDYTSYVDSDKITQIYTGEVAVGSSSTFNTTFVKQAVGDGLTEKSFTQMRYSVDGGVVWQDGDSRLNTYSGGTLQYYLVATCASDATSAYVVVTNAGLSSGAPARTIQYEIVVFSTT